MKGPKYGTNAEPIQCFFNESLLIKSSLIQSISNSPEINNDSAELLHSFMEIQLRVTRDTVYSTKISSHLL